MVAARPLVVVAGAEPPVTDELADRLRETCAVRTAYSTDEVLDRLDADVDVVLVAPGLGPGAVERVRRTIDEQGFPCQLGRLDASAAGDGEDADGEGGEPTTGTGSSPRVVDPAGTDRTLRADVEHLATLAQYRTALDEYFALARRDAGDDTDDAENRLDYVRDRLDDAAADLDPSSLFEAALHDPERGETGDERTEGWPEDRSDDWPDERPDGGVTVGDDTSEAVDDTRRP